jgi:membrane protein DedA with SNARE-associated domain
MTIESSFIPFPSEIVMPPAGYLAYTGKMNIYMVIFTGALGSLFGALVNYYLSLKLGRPFLIKYGKYFFVSENSLEKVERFFYRHGEITTFIGRLLPGIRQYISIPAGLARMNLYRFVLFTFFGASIWIIILTFIGFYIGVNLVLIKEKIHIIMIFMLPTIIFIVIVYLYITKKKNGRLW